MANEEDPNAFKEGSAPRLTRRLCLRCSRSMALQLSIAKFDDQPAYDIFRCDTCGALDWITA